MSSSMRKRIFQAEEHIIKKIDDKKQIGEVVRTEPYLPITVDTLRKSSSVYYV